MYLSSDAVMTEKDSERDCSLPWAGSSLFRCGSMEENRKI